MKWAAMPPHTPPVPSFRGCALNGDVLSVSRVLILMDAFEDGVGGHHSCATRMPVSAWSNHVLTALLCQLQWPEPNLRISPREARTRWEKFSQKRLTPAQLDEGFPLKTPSPGSVQKPQTCRILSSVGLDVLIQRRQNPGE